jgi:hypothetical protein
MVSRFPPSDVYEIVTRIQSGNDVHFRSAVFEGLLHEVLRCQGFRLEVHPALGNERSARPDFLVEGPDGESFYLEATLASESNEVDKPGQTRIDHFLDQLSQHPHENFMLEVDDEGFPASQPSSKRVIRELHSWLNSLDVDAIMVMRAEGRHEDVPFMQWRHEEWIVQFRPWPINPERRGQSERLIGISGSGGGLIDHWSPIRDAVKKKGSKYGELDRPLLVAVNLDSHFLDPIDERQALFGQEEMVFRLDDREKEPRFRRAPNGAWMSKDGPQYTRVSGVWSFNDIQPASIVGKKNTIYFNPWASMPLPEALKVFPHVVAADNLTSWVWRKTGQSS